MANTLTGLIPVIYEGLDIVSREMCGLTRAVSLDSKAKTAAVGQTVSSHVSQEATLEDVVPGNNPADSGDQVIDTVDVKITKSKVSPIRWTGEEQLSVGSQLNTIMADQFAQSIRAIVNAVEVDLAVEGALGACRAYGTPGTTPFGTAGDLSDVAQPMKILTDNGAPLSGRRLGLGTTATAEIRGKQSGLFEVNRAGNDDLLRRGTIGVIQTMDTYESAGIQTPAVGTGSGYLAVGDLDAGTTSLPVDTGSGTVVAGDVISFAGDPNFYVVAEGISAPGTVVINKPGLMQGVADNAAMTISALSTRNLFFNKSALHLAARGPVMPTVNGKAQDAAIDVMNIPDPRSGLIFQVAIYLQYRRVKYEVGLAWGTKTVKNADMGILLG